jgi:ribose transport system substrate-binding protein
MYMTGIKGTCAALAGASLLLSGCSGSSDSEATTAPPRKAETAAASLQLGDPTSALCKGKTYTIGYDSFSDSQPFAVSVSKNLDEAAAKMGCVKLIKVVDNADPQTALSNVQSLAQQKVDGVILFQILADAQPAIAKTLSNAGIPGVATAVPAPGMPYISNDDHQAGMQAGKALAEAFVKKHPGGELPYLIVGGRPAGGPVDKERAQGIVDGVKAVIPKIPDSQVQVIDSNAVQDVAYTQTLNALSRMPADAPVIMSGENEEVVAGMFKAAQQRNRKDLLVMGLGGDSTGLKLVCTQPQYVGTVQFYPEKWGNWLLPAVIGEIQKSELPDTVAIPTEVQTKADIQKTYPNLPCK